jgi:hypothetical protein
MMTLTFGDAPEFRVFEEPIRTLDASYLPSSDVCSTHQDDLLDCEQIVISLKKALPLTNGESVFAPAGMTLPEQPEPDVEHERFAAALA